MLKNDFSWFSVYNMLAYLLPSNGPDFAYVMVILHEIIMSLIIYHKMFNKVDQ